MNLIWVPNQQFALYFLSLCEKNAHLGSFFLFVQDEDVIPEFRLMAEAIGINFVNREFSTSHEFDNFYMFSFGTLSYQESVRSSVRYQKLWLFGDALNNSILLHSTARDWAIEGLVYFGYELIDEAFSAHDMPVIRNKEVINFNDIAKYVKDLQDRKGVPDYRNQIDNSVILVLDRYWGDKSYKIVNWEMYKSYLSKILSKADKSKQIVYKGVESGYLGSAESQRFNIFKDVTDSKFLIWDQIVKVDSNFRYLTSPEALFLGGRIAPGNFFSFDGSTALVAALTQINLNVIWPDEVKPEGIFSEPWIENLIVQKSRMYREVASQYKSDFGVSKIVVSTVGTGIREMIGRFVLGHFVQERDALTQERDALTQERDALTQERDALTQERDALTQERDALTQERDALTQERDALTQERDALTQERDALTQERDALTQERDALTQERDALTQERDALTQERDALTQERDALTQERDALTQERDAITSSTIWRITRPLRVLKSQILR